MDDQSIRCVLDPAIDGRQQLVVSNIRLELEGTKNFENMLHDKIQELKIELGDSNTAREGSSRQRNRDSRMCLRLPVQSEIWW